MDKTKVNNKEIEEKKEELPECFVIMPISNQDGYEDGHFKRVYEDIFIPAIEKAGFKPYRADDAKSSSVIHTTILRRLLEAPMAICDLSSRNPNVLYELGIRQAFDKPVVLVGDDDPSKIFDIGNINTHMYKKSLNYREVIQDQNKIKEMLVETYNNPGKEYNSLLSVLKIESALNIDTNSKDVQDSDVMRIMYQELMSLKGDIKDVNNKLSFIDDSEKEIVATKVTKEAKKYGRLPAQITKVRFMLMVPDSMSDDDKSEKLRKLIQKVNEYKQKYDYRIEIQRTSEDYIEVEISHNTENILNGFIEEILITCNCASTILQKSRFA